LNNPGDLQPLPATLGEALVQARKYLDMVDARILLRESTGATAAQIVAFPERPITAKSAEIFLQWLKRRADGEPVAHILGTREFYGRPFHVTPATLIPRPETELLVELALDLLQPDDAPSILDLGTGSGAIAVSMALEKPDSQVCAVDFSPAALDVAERNAISLGAHVEFLAGDWFAPLEARRFDCILANPPYIAEGDPHLQQGDLRFEPITALASGRDGLEDLCRIIMDARDHLSSGGWLLLEHGYDQAETVRVLLQDAGFKAVRSWQDLSDIERVSGGQNP